jgi:hypothetical protein
MLQLSSKKKVLKTSIFFFSLQLLGGASSSKPLPAFSPISPQMIKFKLDAFYNSGGGMVYFHQVLSQNYNPNFLHLRPYIQIKKHQHKNL